ncbi:MAG TPA: hypothetical protein ENK06_08070, partial [Gammaproteobacteria bacterium]|nr:hypothetical protein [Gammaproteobacteria bacterium]
MSTPLFAGRYSLQEIDEPQVNAINNLGTIVGIDKDGLPFVWRRNQTDNSYPDEADVAEVDRVYKLRLPTDFTDTTTEIHALDINNESLDEDGNLQAGSGGEVAGWYLDENGLAQGIVWYQYENPQAFRGFRYTWVKLPPHQLVAPYCSGESEADFLQTECMTPQDSDLIYRATLCAENANWEAPNQIYVDQAFDYTIREDGSREIPGCGGRFSVEICSYKEEKQPDEPGQRELEDGTIVEVPAFKYVKN